MSASVTVSAESRPLNCGLRMTADAFLKMPDDGNNYELIDGVVIVSPSPTPKHQFVTGEIFVQLSLFLRQQPAGVALVETDVHLGQAPGGGDLIYRPEVIFLRSDRLAQIEETISGAPDLVVEVVSRGSRRFDSETKKQDYERFGVREYWLIDPARTAMTFYRLVQARFIEVSPTTDSFSSEAVPGFVLDLARVRKSFTPW